SPEITGQAVAANGRDKRGDHPMVLRAREPCVALRRLSLMVEWSSSIQASCDRIGPVGRAAHGAGAQKPDFTFHMSANSSKAFGPRLADFRTDTLTASHVMARKDRLLISPVIARQR